MPRLKSTICHGADLTTDHTAIVGSGVVMVLAWADMALWPRTEVLRGAVVLPPLMEVAVRSSCDPEEGTRIWGPARRKCTRGRRAAIRASARAHSEATAATGTPSASAAK